eukprot:TRINITY_DN17824_c0_g1_i1.p1 TRINITY_DN17824_c0_g1~~TRINITY_DN17824_c0_g1_i1.p1  ORF type:complete len:260 (+),score=31.51 TRINITY_DN17824_c0_g1_i1:71-850(+)
MCIRDRCSPARKASAYCPGDQIPSLYPRTHRRLFPCSCLSPGVGLRVTANSWRPDSADADSSIPLDFTGDDESIDLTNGIYFGFRPQSSSTMHSKFSKQHQYAFNRPSKPTYNLIDIGKRLHRTESQAERPLGMTGECNYEFDSCFEGGNLDAVVKVGEDEFDLYMRVDANTKGHNQWFYFAVKAAEARSVRMNIVNFAKSDSLFRQGMRVAVFSEKKAEYSTSELYKQWHKGGENITYKPSRLSHDLLQCAKIMYCCV